MQKSSKFVIFNCSKWNYQIEKTKAATFKCTQSENKGNNCFQGEFLQLHLFPFSLSPTLVWQLYGWTPTGQPASFPPFLSLSPLKSLTLVSVHLCPSSDNLEMKQQVERECLNQAWKWTILSFQNNCFTKSVNVFFHNPISRFMKELSSCKHDFQSSGKPTVKIFPAITCLIV